MCEFKRCVYEFSTRAYSGAQGFCGSPDGQNNELSLKARVIGQSDSKISRVPVLFRLVLDLTRLFREEDLFVVFVTSGKPSKPRRKHPPYS
ncbi:hypothetical protein ACROYT_G021710 [Oculina patagonica]